MIATDRPELLRSQPPTLCSERKIKTALSAKDGAPSASRGTEKKKPGAPGRGRGARRRCFVPGGIATASRKARRCAHGSTEWLRTPASKVSLWCGSKHRPKHFNEGTYTVVADCDSDLRDRFALCQHLKGSKQPRLLSPTAK